MNSYLINNKIINMNPLYGNIRGNSEKFKIPYTEKADYIINCDNENYKKFIETHTHLTLEEAEIIITARQFSSIMIECNSVMLHASAILYDNCAYLFSAKSKTGKTTHTKLWQDYFGKDNVIVINDDKPIINTVENTVKIYGSPWAGDSTECENVSALVKAIVFLEQGKENKLVSFEDEEQILPLLLEQTTHKVSIDKMNKILDTLGIIVKNCKFYKLTCNMSKEAVEESKKIIFSEEVE